MVAQSANTKNYWTVHFSEWIVKYVKCLSIKLKKEYNINEKNDGQGTRERCKD